jgi:hypothetical protein
MVSSFLGEIHTVSNMPLNDNNPFSGKPKGRPVQFQVGQPTLVSNTNQTLSILDGLIKGVKKRLTGVEAQASALATANAYPAKLRQIDITQQPTVEGSVLKSAVSVYFSYDPNNPPAAVDIYITGLNSNTNPVFVARGQGTQSPITFSVTASGQQVTITAVTENSKGVQQPFANAISVGVTLNGSASAVAGTPTGYGPLAWAAAATSTDSTINYGDYGYASMASLPAGINNTYIYARWTGYIVPSKTGEYTIGLNSDDGANLYICGQLVGSDKLSTQRAMAGNVTYCSGSSAQILLTKGVDYPITIEWEHGAGSYGIQLLWTPPNGSVELVPSTNLSTSATSVTGNLTGTWWNGSSGLWFPNGSGLIDPGNKTLFGPPTNSGGTNIVNGVTAVTTATTTGVTSPNTFIGPGWLKGQAWSSGGIIDTLICVNTFNTGYMFRCDFRSGSPLGYILSVSDKATSSWTLIGTIYVGNNSATVNGWVNFDIYVGLNGYMALWVNNNLAADVTDLTYDTIPASGYTGNEVQYGYEVSTGKLAPAPNASGAGSTALNPQGSIATISDYTFSYTSTSTTITWSWGAFNVYCPDGSLYAVAASTGTATTETSLSTTVSGTTPFKWTGLSASTTYYFTPFVKLNSYGTGTVCIMVTGLAAPTLTQQVQNCQADGYTPCSASIFVTAATPASGSGGGSGGGSGASCFSPNTKVKTQRGDVALMDLVPETDIVLTARGTWKTVASVTSTYWHGLLLDMGDEELSTITHLVQEGTWKPMKDLKRFPTVAYEGTVHTIVIECDPSDDGTALDTEHSYTLANGLIVHNIHTAV